MAAERGQKSKGWLERQGSSLRQKARNEFETSPAGRRLTPRLFLRKDDWHEKEIDKRKDGQRPELTHQ
jgi:hypothetical protein